MNKVTIAILLAAALTASAECQKGFEKALSNAQQAKLSDVEDFLKGLEPIPVFDVDRNVLCNVKLVEDLALDRDHYILMDWPPEKFAKALKGNLIKDNRGVPLRLTPNGPSKETQDALDKAPWIPAGFIEADDKRALLTRQVTLPAVSRPIPGAFPGGVDEAAKGLKMDPKALETIAARWRAIPCQYGQAATVKVCKDLETSSSKPPTPATRADFAGVHLGDRLPDALAALARGGYVGNVEDKFVVLHVTCTAKTVDSDAIYPCSVGSARFKKKDASGNSYAAVLEFTEMPNESSATRPGRPENRELRLGLANPAASIVAAEPRLGNVLVARITGFIQLASSTSIDRYTQLAIQKYPDLTDKWDPGLVTSAASQPETGHYSQKSLFGSKERCKFYDPRATAQDYARQDYTNCLGAGIYREDGLVVAISDAWFVYLRNDKTEKAMIEAVAKRDGQGPKF